MTIWCVDANVVVATLVQEASTDAAERFWQTVPLGDEVIAPLVLFPECISAFRRKVVGGEITPAEGYQIIEDMLSLSIRVDPSPDQFRLSFDWATRMRRTRTHDLQYLALAHIQGATVVTLDSGLEQAAHEHRVAVRRIQ